MKVTARTGNFKFRDDINGNYNISHDVTDTVDDDIVTAIMLFKVSEITLDEVMCYFAYREDPEGCCRDKKRNHDYVSGLVWKATATVRAYS